MTTKIFVTSVSGSDEQATLGDYDDLYIAKNVTVGSTDYNAIISQGSAHTAIIDGTIVAHYSGLILGDNLDANHSQHLKVSGDGQILGLKNAGAIIYGYDSIVENKGYIYGHQEGLKLKGISTNTQSQIINSGSIEGDKYGVTHYNVDSTETLNITNTGTIKGGLYSFYDAGANAIENITNAGTMTGNVSLGLGGDLFNDLHGSVSGTIDGGAGNDQFVTGAFAETFNGGTGSDIFYFETKPDSSSIDHIKDFHHGEDHICLLKTLFALGAGNDMVHAFRDVTTQAEQADDRVLYNHDTGALYYDVDGNKPGGKAPVQFAVLDNHPAINYHDFFLL